MANFNIRSMVGANLCVRPMLIALFAIGVIMVSCGGGSGNQQSGTTTSETTQQATVAGSELRVKDANISNWQAVIKATRGVDIPMPDGWTVESAKPASGNSYVEVVFNISGSTTGEVFGQMLMNATKAAAKNGNHQIEVTERGTEEGKAVEKYSEVSMSGDGITYYANWCFTTNYVWQIHYYANDNKKQASFSF